MRDRRRKVKHPMEQRLEVQRQRIARLLFLGLNAEQIARRLGRKAQAIRYACAQPEFKTFFETFQRERFAAMDRQLVAMLGDGITALRRQLRHRDPWVVDAALEKIFKIHGRFVEKLDITGSLAHTSQPGWWEMPMDDMRSDEQRVLARELLKATRQRESSESPSRLLRNAQGQPPEEG